MTYLYQALSANFNYLLRFNPGWNWGYWESVQFSSVTQSCLTLCNPIDCSTPGFLVHHQLPELAQTHAHLVGHWVGDAIQPSHPLSSPSPVFNLSQRQELIETQPCNLCGLGRLSSDTWNLRSLIMTSSSSRSF